MDIDTLAHLCDEYLRKRQARLAASREVRDLKAEEEALAYKLRMAMLGGDLTRAGGKEGSIKLRRRMKPSVNDWSGVEKYAMENEAMQIFQRRLNNKAVEEITDEGVDIPGVYWVEIVDFTIGE